MSCGLIASRTGRTLGLVKTSNRCLWKRISPRWPRTFAASAAGSCGSGPTTSGFRSAVSAIFRWPGVPRRQCGGNVAFQSGVAEISATPDWKATFPPHCLRGTPGQRKIAETALRNPLVVGPEPQDPAALAAKVRGHRGDILFHKHRFDVFTNPNVLPVLDAINPHDIVLYGVALDVCDKYAIEGLLQHRPQVRLFAVVDAMKPIDRDVAEHLLKEWGEEGVRLVKTSEVVMGGLIEELAQAGAA